MFFPPHTQEKNTLWNPTFLPLSDRASIIWLPLNTYFFKTSENIGKVSTLTSLCGKTLCPFTLHAAEPPRRVLSPGNRRVARCNSLETLCAAGEPSKSPQASSFRLKQRNLFPVKPPSTSQNSGLEKWMTAPAPIGSGEEHFGEVCNPILGSQGWEF